MSLRNESCSSAPGGGSKDSKDRGEGESNGQDGSKKLSLSPGGEEVVRGKSYSGVAKSQKERSELSSRCQAGYHLAKEQSLFQ